MAPPAKSCVAAGWWQQPVATLHLHEHDARILGEIWVYEMVGGLDWAALEAQADDDEGLFGDHLRRLLDSLRRDAALCEVVRGLLQGQPCPTAGGFYRLRSAGVVVGNSAREAKLRCQLYANYLSRRLL